MLPGLKLSVRAVATPIIILALATGFANIFFPASSGFSILSWTAFLLVSSTVALMACRKLGKPRKEADAGNELLDRLEEHIDNQLKKYESD